MRLSFLRHPLRPAALALATAVLPLTGCGSSINLDEPIEGPVWRLVDLGGEPVPADTDPLRGPQLQFDRGSGRVSGSGGCNRLAGSYQRSGGTLRMGQLAATKMACTDPARSGTESRFFDALQTTTSYRLPGPGRMALLDANGRTLATLVSGPGR